MFGRQHPLTLRRLRYWLWLVLLGTLANATVVDLPFVVPFAIGNVALFLILRRLGVLWSLPAAGFILLPLWQNLAFAASLLQLLVLFGLNQRVRQHSLVAIALYMGGCALLFHSMAPAKISAEPLLLLLHCGLSTAVFGFCLRAMLILDTLTRSQQQEQQQSLSLQLSHRVAMYSSIPSTFLIALVLHGATALDLSRSLQRFDAEQHQLAEQIGQRLAVYPRQLSLASAMLDHSGAPAVLPVLTAQSPEFISALLTDNKGTVLNFYKASLPDTARTGSNVADRRYFSEARRTGQAFISDTFLGRNLGQDPLFAVSVPRFTSKGDFDGVLEVSVNLKQLTTAITLTDSDISHRVLLDREQKKIWGTDDNRPLGEVWSVSSQSDPQPRKFLRYSWFNSFGPVVLTVNAAHLLLLHHVTPGQWQLKYFIDTDTFVLKYHLFLALALLTALLLLEAITALSRAFVSRYTAALEQLAQTASTWQPDDAPQPRPDFAQSAAEFETLANTISDMQHRVKGARLAMHQSMQQIVTLNNELEQRVSHRTEELQQERDRATRLAAIKSRFLANMSHEIRTPITVIKGFTEQLLRQGLTQQQPEINRIHQNTLHLQRLVDDILDTAKIDEGKMQLDIQHFALGAFLLDLQAHAAALVSEKQLKLVVEVDAVQTLWLRADPFRLRQIMLNLLSNAVKFTARGQVRLQAGILADGSVQIKVSDDGIGISAEQLPLLFNAFSQADSSTSRTFGGTGLGLYISKQLAQAMQFSLEVQSSVGQGSVFSLRVPAEFVSTVPALVEEPVSTGPSAVTLQQARLLIVDDVADIRALLASYLADQPLQLSFASDGKAAVAICAEQEFDLILMDQQMPELDGIHATRAIRAMGVSTPVVSLSADVFEDPQKNTADLFQYRMNKPVAREQLLTVIASAQAAYPPSAPALSQTSTSAATEDQLLHDYRQSLSAQAVTLQQLYQSGDRPGTARLLHQIKGTSACFGLQQISTLAQQAAQQLKQAPTANAINLLVSALQQAATDSA